MRLQVVLMLASLALCSAVKKWTSRSDSTTVSGIDAAKFLQNQYFNSLQGGGSQGPDSRYGQGPSSGSGQGVSPGFGPGPSSGSGQGVGQGFGPGPSSGSGQGSNQGFGPGPSSGSGQGSSPGFGPGPSSGSGQGVNPGFGPGPNSGSGQGVSPGPSSGSGQGSSQGFGPGSSSGSGQGVGPGPSSGSSQGTGPGSAPGSSKAPKRCYIQQDEGVCVKSTMCNMATPKIDPTTLFTFRTKQISTYECNFLEMCCPKDKVRPAPVPPSVRLAPGCGYSNAAVGRFRELAPGSESGYADFAEFPWMVALLKNSPNSQSDTWDDSNYLGGGTLIHPSVVITTAHKVYSLRPSDLKCRAGEWDTEKDNEAYTHQDREVKDMVIHSQFNRQHAHFNLAMLTMATPFEITPHINIACLSPYEPPPGTQCYSMGWGEDFTKGKYNANVLKKIPLPIMDRAECERRFQNSILTQAYRLHFTLTCAGGVDSHLDTCIGDGGSPLVCPIGDPTDKRYAVVGMVTYGLECGSTQYPGAYTNIPAIFQWIQTQLVNQYIYDTSFIANI